MKIFSHSFHSHAFRLALRGDREMRGGVGGDGWGVGGDGWGVGGDEWGWEEMSGGGRR